eukprot:TRINITY_DN6997_c0_g1_i1.p1 TRINITY_DN6997_c0_g1~~TRINITY_DN6997_c0_g1_i1.p1  ORF type:complete len:206 (+),score=24.15 TRINITY_DN6997_c0_g1_i1:3-620(+)
MFISLLVFCFLFFVFFFFFCFYFLFFFFFFFFFFFLYEFIFSSVFFFVLLSIRVLFWLFHQRRIELLATQVVQLFQRLLMPQGAAVGLVLEHCAERISHAGDFGGHADPLEFQAARIAAAIPTLMVPGNRNDHFLRDIGLRIENFQRTGDMRAHQFSFIGRQIGFFWPAVRSAVEFCRCPAASRPCQARAAAGRASQYGCRAGSY